MIFTDEQKLLINNDSTQKQLHITFPNNTDIAEITNDRIYQEEMSLEESLIDQDNIQFGKCNGALFTVKVADFVENIANKRMDVSITFSNSTLGTSLDVPLGRFIVNEPPERTADRRFKIIKAQDYMILFDVDISEWYNTVLFPTDDTTRSLYQCLEMLCEYIGVEFDTEFGFIHSDLVIKKNIVPTQLSGRDFLQQICELEACFGHFNELGILSFIRLEKSALYPSETLYPSNTLYPRGSSETECITLYKECDYQDYDVKSINSVKIRMEDDDIGVVSQLDGVTRVNQYSITGNTFTYGLTTEELQSVADKLLISFSNLLYRPNTTTVKGGIYMNLGQSYTVLTKDDGFESYVLNRTLNGIQAISTTIEADGEEYISEVSNSPLDETKILHGKVSRLKHDIDGLSLEFADYSESTSAKIEANAESISAEVKRATEKEGELSSRIDVNAESISSEVSRAKESEADLSSRIEQTVSSISLTVNNGDTTAGIVITLENEDGTTSQVSGTIDMTGLVSFTDLAGQGTTTINGSNITTGTINCDLLNGGAINGQKIVGGSIDGTYIDGSNISANRLSSVGTSYLDSIQIGGNERISYTSILTVIYGVINPGLNDCLNISSELQVQQGINCLGDFLLPIAYNNTTTNKINVNISSSGRFRRNTESSKKYKHDITTHLKSKLNPKNLLNANIYQYKYNNDYLSSEDLRYNTDVIGFIVEDLEKHYPIAIDYNEDDNGNLIPQDWNERFIIPPMLKLIQEQQKEIETLKSEMEEMKATISFLMERIGTNNE